MVRPAATAARRGPKALPAALLACTALFAAPVARAVDGVSVELGRSISSYTDLPLARVGLQWNWQSRLASSGNWYLGGYWDLTAGYWRNDSEPRIRTSSGVVDISLTPMLRWQQEAKDRLSPFVEGGVGLHWLSEDSITSLRELSGHLQFGSVAGTGLRFGGRHEYEVGYRVQHLSNAGLRQPNSGINLHSIRLQYHF